MKFKSTFILIPLCLFIFLPGTGCKQEPGKTIVNGSELTFLSGEFTPSADLQGRYLLIDELSDEFENQVLDEKKWYNYNPTWTGRRPAYFAPENVEIRQGKLHLYMRAEDPPDSLKENGYHSFSTASVRSKFLVKYGYFEVKAKAMDCVSSNAFWFQSPPTDTLSTEIDVFELCGGCGEADYRGIIKSYAQRYPMTVHIQKTPMRREKPSSLGEQIKEKIYYPEAEEGTTSDAEFSHSGQSELADFPFHRELKLPFKVSEGFHVYGMLWTPYELTWYVDGNPVWTLENTYWHQPLTLNFNVETKPGWFGLPQKEDLPAAFSIEYVRAWKLESLWNGEFEWSKRW